MYYGYIETNETNDSEGTKRKILFNHIYRHENYSQKTLQNDIALVQVSLVDLAQRPTVFYFTNQPTFCSLFP